MKQYWNIISTSGSPLIKAPIYGTREQATAYMNLCYEFCALIEYKPFDLDLVEFTTTLNKCDFDMRKAVFEARNSLEILFRFKLVFNKIILIDENDYEIQEIPIEQMMLFPQFKENIELKSLFNINNHYI